LAPRGYCYVTGSDFFGYNKNASIWHDGSGGEDHKLVIRSSNFDGIEGFALGRHHKDAAFFLLDCHFSKNMKTSQGIVHVPSDSLKWGERYYYHNVHKTPDDLPWMVDNLHLANGNPKPVDVTVLWTFNGQWDPESNLDGLLSFALQLLPGNGSTIDYQSVVLKWAKAYCADSYRIYFGKAGEIKLIGSTSENSFPAGNLEAGATYFWRIDAIRQNSIIEGELWNFKTKNLSTSIDENSTIREEFSIRQTYPNPSNHEMMVYFAIPDSGLVELNLFNMNGLMVQSLLTTWLQKGSHQRIVTVDAGLPSGIYFAKLIFKQKFVDYSKVIIK
jgi:hypothetical protein